jgi:2-oxoglutarate ferredoxin oxidoreductase subunit beta
MSTEIKLTRKDFLSTAEPKWCSACGCYSVLRALTNTFPQIGIPREDFAVISGIGCSSRLPYYVNTYGFHTIHGRAPTVAMGLKLANPKESVWVITGDGDGLSIGGNHIMHLLRRNPNIKVILFNNRIYGLTKGQTSPTSPAGSHTKSAPFGSVEQPVHPISLAIAAGATFAARIPGTVLPMLNETFKEAAAHKGVAFIEVMLNCVVFNDGAFEELTDPEKATENTARLAAGKPIIFGAHSNRGIRLNQGRPEVVSFTEGNPPADLLIHDPSVQDSSLAFMLSRLELTPGMPTTMGIFRRVSAPVFEDNLVDLSGGDLNPVLRGEEAWMETG